MSHIHELLLSTGMSVEVRGQLVLRQEVPVVTGLNMVSPEPGTPPELQWMQTPYIPIANVEDFEDVITSALGQPVYGRGIWLDSDNMGDTDGTGTSESAEAHAVQLTCLEATDEWAKTRVREYKTKDATPVSPHTRTIEAPLFSDGVMLRRVRVRDEFGPRVLVSATNVERVREALLPVYGDPLEVYESPWTASEIRGLDDVLNSLPDERVLKLEYRMNSEGVLSRKLRVDYVDEELVAALQSFPSEMLFVEAVVEPEGTLQDRDLFYPIQPRTQTP